MSSNISIDLEKSRIWALLNICWMAVVVYLVFMLLSVISFGILDIACRLKLMIHENSLHINWQKLIANPLYIFDLYGVWWQTLLRSMRLMMIRSVLFVPFVVPAGMAIAIIVVCIKRNYSFSLWYVLNYHFAKLKDIEDMGLNKGLFMVLGRFGNIVLSVKPAESVLCVGEMGTGKTSSVAIPSILRSDNACIIAVDTTGLLPKYTAGHRAELGQVIYYNWDLLDDPEKGMFYPRWNPLASENLPKSVSEKEEYLKRIAGYLVEINEQDKDNYWSLLANSVITSFLGFWEAKVNQAQANDYFLGKLLENKHLSKDEKDILLSYYIQMPQQYTKDVMEALKNDTLNKDNYLPIGSWAGIPEQWIGREVCFASITDWVISNYMASQDDNKDWRGWIESLLRETVLFSYDSIIINGLKQFLALSVKQRQLAFAYIIKPFKLFTNQAIRERTSENDFNLDDIRGIYDEKNNCWHPVTIYSLANTYTSKILNRMFLDEALYRNLYMKESKGALPVMLVLDDVGHNLRLKNLTKLLTSGKPKKMSALLLCNSLVLVENTYSREELEAFVMNTSYKIIKAPDNQKLSRQLDKLATFATRSVQIPKGKSKHRLGKQKYFANASYFHRLAKDFNLRKNVKIDTKDHQIVLAEGYYNRPILANNIFFSEDDRFKHLAVLDAEYSLSPDKLATKTEFELQTPKISEVFNQKDLGVDDLVELEQYMNIVFDEMQFELKEKRQDEVKSPRKEAETSEVGLQRGLMEQRSANIQHNTVSQSKENGQIKKAENGFSQSAIKEEKDWWLDETSFQVDKKENPFKNKK